MSFIERTVLFVLLSLYSCEGQCPQTWTQYNDSCFAYNPAFMNWVDAERSCRSFGAHLACPSTRQKDLDLRNFMTSKGAEYTTWIDGTDQMEIGYWFCASILERLTYEHWSPGEPNHNGSELCLAVVDYNNHWLNRPCRSKHPFVCELRANQPNGGVVG